ncbi:streptomycin 6-kinase/streptomycin 6-kinase [Streptomyces sp. ScaeMP-e83]|nr:streptomycin 6-kinase/streptomycin 6-kinase [Streptomyces sp. ScaeMP-e83]
MNPAPSPAFDVPDALVASYAAPGGARGRAWVAALPRLATDLLGRWELWRDGPVAHGMAGLVLPVVRADGTRAVLKLQPPSEGNSAEARRHRRRDGGAGARGAGAAA